VSDPLDREAHPIADAPDWPLEKRVQYLEVQLARLWDQVWWMNLPAEQRAIYEAQGFGDPIPQWYGPEARG